METLNNIIKSTPVSSLIQKVSAQQVNQYAMDDFDLVGKHILITEDNPLNQMIITTMMSSWKNTKITITSNGLECLEIMKKQSFDLILMDIQMPVMDGYQTISAIKKGFAGVENLNVPIIVLTSDITDDTRKRVFCLGVGVFK
ncbi:response regulator [Pedobacter rhodius]|uniref:Response regulator n=1 Tax=Pedobacter rhodius TaxID=3004098 RepID=A0ABT4KSX1_9SPHI|nr:response regulator [Pedobacter sp. SJ11]MCZ4221821.1 response regulator [Pedobacter sp. SJ11]